MTAVSQSTSYKNLYDEIQRLAIKENLHLAYESGLLQNKYVDIDLDGISFDKSLDLILKDTGLEYILTKDKQLLLRKKEKDRLNKIILSGQIKDKLNKTKISQAAISLKGATVGCYTDNDGKFSLVIPRNYINGKDTIVVHRLGYRDKKIGLNEFIYNSDVELEVSSRLLPLITILKPLKKIEYSISFANYRIDNKEYIFSSFITEDILRKIQFLPSIYANKDKSSQLNIRGSKAFETLVLVDGLRVYHPTHFYNVFSSINDDYIKEITVYKNTIPPSIRSMTGGVVSMISNPVSKETISADLEANLMYLSSAIRIPIANNIGLALSARKSIFDKTQHSFLNDIIAPTKNTSLIFTRKDKIPPEFRFHDMNGLMEYKINDNNKIQISFFNSRDFFDDEYENIVKHNDQSKILSKIKYSNINTWVNAGIGIKYNLKWKKLISDIALSATEYKDESNLDIVLLKKRKDSIRTKTISDSKTNALGDLVFKIDNRVKTGKNTLFNFGLDITGYSVHSVIAPRKYSIIDISKKLNSYSIYSGYTGKIVHFGYSFSLKSSFYTGTNKYYFDPALNINYRLSKYLYLYSSINKQHQYLRQFEYESPQSLNSSFWDLADNHTPVLSSNTISFGGKLNYKNTTLTIETYYKTQNGLSILLRPKPSNRNETDPQKQEYKIFYGDSYNYGLDLMWTQNIGNYSNQLSYTYSIFNQRFRQIFHNRYYPAPTDTRHQIKLIQSYTWNKWSFGLNFIYSSGTPYFDFSNLNRDSHRSEILFEDYIKYLPDYFRSDLSINYKLSIFNKQSSIKLTVFNLTNRTNITERRLIHTNRDFNPNNSTSLFQSQTNLLNRTVNVGIRISF